jgi:hypothetical protein
MRLWILVMLGLGFSLPAYAGFTLYYSADPIEAKVIDVETKQPLEGVIVVAHWELVHGSPGGDSPAGQLMVKEAVTDKNGKFRFPGWGPKLAVLGHLSDYRDPELVLFKSGYEYRELTNALTGEDKGARRRSDWYGKTIEMKQLADSNKNSYLSSDLDFVLGFLIETDAWKETPCALLALDAEAKRMGFKSVLNYFPISNVKRRDEINKFLARTNQCKKL